MKSKNQIYMNYQATKQKASRLEELAAELRALAENQVGCYSTNKGMWQGDSGDACRQKLKKLECDIERRARELERTARSLKAAADRQYRLEMALVALVSG